MVYIDNMSGKEKRGILTLAVGKKFRRQAKYLAYSCMLHCPELLRAVITDSKDGVEDLYDFIIPYDQSANPFETKLLLNRYTPFEETVFIDSDALVYSDIRCLFEYFGDQSFIYVGNTLTEGVWGFNNLSETIKKLNIPWVGKLNSGVFLFRSDGTGNRVFECARSLYKDADELNIPLFRGSMYSDEPFLAIAFGKYLQKPVVNDYGRFGRSTINKKKIRVDILRGYASFVLENVFQFPAIIHFCDHRTLYFREKIKLFLYIKTPLGYFAIFLVANTAKLFYDLFDFTGGFIKRCFRKVIKCKKNICCKM